MEDSSIYDHTDTGEPLTDEQYLSDGGNICPFCESKNIEGGPIEADSGNAIGAVKCLECEGEWDDCYVLVGYIDVR